MYVFESSLYGGILTGGGSGDVGLLLEDTPATIFACLYLLAKSGGGTLLEDALTTIFARLYLSAKSVSLKLHMGHLKDWLNSMLRSWKTSSLPF